MKAIYGLYNDPHVAQQAVDNLRAAGVADANITVISSEPFDHFEFGHRDAKTAMPWIATAAGAAGLVLTYYLLGLSQRAWPLVTSGMPIVPNWTNDHHFRDDDAERDHRHGDHAAGDRRHPESGRQDVRPGSLRRLHPRRRRESH
jgi:fatty acid desaturase